MNSGSSLLHGAQATGTNVDCFAAFQFYFANIGLPGSVGFAVRVRNVLTENNAFTTDTALCHPLTPPKNYSSPLLFSKRHTDTVQHLLLYHIFSQNARDFLNFFQFFISIKKNDK